MDALESLTTFYEDNTPENFKKFYEPIYPFLLVYANRLLNGEGAEEVVNDTFIKVYTLKPAMESPLPFMKKMVRNRCFDVLKVRKRQLIFESIENNYAFIEGENNVTPMTENLLILDDNHKLIKLFTSHLSKQECQVVMLRINEFSNDEIAQTMHIQVQSVWKYLKRLRSKLKNSKDQTIRNYIKKLA